MKREETVLELLSAMQSKCIGAFSMQLCVDAESGICY